MSLKSDLAEDEDSVLARLAGGIDGLESDESNDLPTRVPVVLTFCSGTVLWRDRLWNSCSVLGGGSEARLVFLLRLGTHFFE